jgi:hypothetical protein
MVAPPEELARVWMVRSLLVREVDDTVSTKAVQAQTFSDDNTDLFYWNPYTKRHFILAVVITLLQLGKLEWLALPVHRSEKVRLAK